MSRYQHDAYTTERYADGLRIIQCAECAYAFALVIDDQRGPLFGTKVTVKRGDREVSHSWRWEGRV